MRDRRKRKGYKRPEICCYDLDYVVCLNMQSIPDDGNSREEEIKLSKNTTDVNSNPFEENIFKN